jgi:hypothetical protein
MPPRLLLAVAPLAIAACPAFSDADDLDGARDAGFGEDVAADADTERDASVGSGFCESLVPKPTFCDDFDGLFPDRWTVEQQPASAIARVGDPHVSSPYALRLDRGAGSSWAHIHRSFPDVTPAEELVLDMQVYVSKRADAAFELAVIELAHLDDVPYAVELELLGDGTLRLEEDIPSGGGRRVERQLRTELPVRLGAWTHMTVKVSLNPPLSSSLTITVEGGEGFTEALSAHGFIDAPALRLGEDSKEADRASTTLFDDVVFDVR